MTTADINGGTIDETTIATSDITVGSGKTLNVSDGNLTLADNQISGDKVEGGTINAITITTLGSATVNSTTVNSTTVDTTNIEVTNIKAKDGTSCATIADSTGVITIPSSVLTTADINGGTIDGTIIGGASRATGNFTTLNASGALSCGAITSTGNSSMEKLTVDSVVLDGTSITNGTATLNAGALSGVTNLTMSGSLVGPNEFVIDPLATGDASGTVIIRGSLQVNGTTTTVNSTQVDISDISLKLASNASGANLNGAGIELGSDGSVTFQYQYSTTSWLSNKEIIGPSQDPQRAYALANKKYVDDQITSVTNSITRNIVFKKSNQLDKVVNKTSGEQDLSGSGYIVQIDNVAADSNVRVSMNIGYITSWEADQTISFHVYRGDSKIAEDLYIGNGNAAGPAVGKWSFDFIDADAGTGTNIYSLRMTLNGSDYDYDSGILGTTAFVPITDGNEYKMSNSIVVEELY